MAFKFTKKDNLNLTAEINKFNAKLAREIKKASPDVVMPNKLKVREVKKTFSDRAEFNAVLSNLKHMRHNNYFKPDNIKTTKTVRGVKEQIARDTESANRLREAELARIKRLKRKIGGVASPENEIREEKLDDLRPLKPKTITNPETLKRVSKRLGEMAQTDYLSLQNERYKANYIKGLLHIFGEKAYELIYKIEKVSPETFGTLYFTDELGDLAFIYDPMEQEMKMTVLERIWSPYTSRSMQGYTRNKSFKKRMEEISETLN